MKNESTNHLLIVTHAVLVGLTPLIPIPFLDDMVKSYFQRRLVRKLAARYEQEFADETVRTIADDKGSGCLLGCLGTVVIYPLKKLLRKILIFLEWKRAVDLTSLTYHRGLLIEHALESGRLSPAGPHAPARVRQAIDGAIAETPTRLVEDTVRTTFLTSKRALKSAASLLTSAIRGTPTKADPDDVADVVEAVEPEEEKKIEGVVSSLAARFDALPTEHFDRMRDRFDGLLDENPPRESVTPESS